MKHGTLTAYKNRGCRCDDCRRAAVRNVKQWRSRTQADLKSGVPAIPDLIDITPARAHYWRLRDSGWTVADIAGEVGLSSAHLSWLMGPANTRPRMLRSRASAILDLEPLTPVDIDPVVVDRLIEADDWRGIPRTAAERDAAIRALDACGMSRNEIARRSHVNTRTLYAAFTTAAALSTGCVAGISTPAQDSRHAS